MGLSRLSDKCRTCPFVDTCNHKRMEALGYFPEPSTISPVRINIEPKLDIIESLMKELSIVTQIPYDMLWGTK